MRDAHILGLGPVYQMTEDPASVAAMGIDAAFAVVAATAGSDAGYQHLVANLDVAHAVTDFFHHPQAFVAQDAARLYGGHIAFQDVQVGAANGGMSDADHRLSLIH